MKTLKEICLEYFSANPEAKKLVIEKSGLKTIESSSITQIDIKGTIKLEEEKYLKLIERAKKIVSELKFEEIDGVKLCKLHDTYGIDPTIVEDILNRDLPSSVHDEYLAEREKIKALSRAAIKREVIKVESI